MKPFVRAQLVVPEPTLRAQLASDGLDQATIDAQIKALHAAEVWKNDQFQVIVDRDPPRGEGFPPLIHLSIRRLDRKPIRDWRKMQAIKNALVGPDHEGVELYPAESRKLDQANQYHLYVLRDPLPAALFPFGATERDVLDNPGGGAVQRKGALMTAQQVTHVFTEDEVRAAFQEAFCIGLDITADDDWRAKMNGAWEQYRRAHMNARS